MDGLTPAEALYQLLLSKKIIGSYGKIFFEMQGSKCQIRDNSIVGNVIQAWLQSFMEDNQIPYKLRENTQEFPDFFLNRNRDDIDLLEVKCFTKSANFDVANFLSYCHSIAINPYRLNTDYLIFEYKNSDIGIVIKNIWLQKVWQICGASQRMDLKLQVKKGQIYNIRPSNWYGKGNIKYPPFQTRCEFVQALQKILNIHQSADILRKNYLRNVSRLFKKQTGQDL